MSAFMAVGKYRRRARINGFASVALLILLTLSCYLNWVYLREMGKAADVIRAATRELRAMPALIRAYGQCRSDLFRLGSELPLDCTHDLKGDLNCTSPPIELGHGSGKGKQ